MNNSINVYKRAIATVIAFIFVFCSFTFSYAGSAKYEKGGTELLTNTSDGNSIYDSIKNNLPRLANGSIPPPSYQGYPMNFRLWQQKGILVYGNYNSVKDQNQFKLGTQVSPGVAASSDGYYYGTDSHTGKSGRGEWRYHGIDVSGNLFSNMNFIDDGSKTKFNERNWVFKPWDSLPQTKRPVASQYNSYALSINGNLNYDESKQASIMTWIDKTLPDGVPLKNSPVDPETYKYLNILSAPTSMMSGQGRMWHKKDDGSIWYQTLSVPVLKETLQNLPVTVAIYCINPASDLVIKDPGTQKDNQEITLKFKVIATLEDEKDGRKLYSDPIDKTVYYTRNDISSWSITFNESQTKGDISTVGNKGVAEFTETVTYGYLRSRNWKEFVTAAAQPLYRNTVKGNIGHGSLEIPLNSTPLPPPVVSATTPVFTPDNSIPEIAYEDVPFVATDSSDKSLISVRKVFVDGQEVDDDLFFSGSYVFDTGDLGTNGQFVVVEVDYTIEDIHLDAGEKICTTDYVYVYPTKPIANFRISSNTWKQNRKIKVEDTSAAGNIQLVTQKYPITEYEWTFGGDTGQIKVGTDTTTTKEFICKEPGIYSITLRCKNSLGKWSDPYTVEFEVLEDVAPAIGLNLTDCVTSRNESMNAWYYNICSTDGDVIKSSSIELWYDADNDGNLDTRLKTWDRSGEFPSYTPTALGYYKYIVKAQEDIVDDTFPQFITEDDKKSSSYEVEWWVDNYRPMSDIYINKPIQRPNIDVYFVLDKNLDQTKREYIQSNRMNMANWLIGENIIPNVSIWDLKTYTYTQPASTSSHTGSSYPSSSVSYSSNGYSGTLNLTSISNNSYSRDEGHTSTKTETKTATAGGQSVSGHGASSNYPPSSVSYSDADGYSGSLSAYGYSYNSWACDHSPKNIGPGGCKGGSYYWTRSYAGYSGTVSRTVSYWVPNIVWYNDYTGYYSGTINKDVRQSYENPFNPTAIKYVVYISDNTLSDLSDLQFVMGKATSASLLLAGANGISSQISCKKCFDSTNKNIDTLLNEILQYIAQSSPTVEKCYILQNEAFTLNTGNLDLENDPIELQEMQYVHNPDYFDNPTGVEPGSISGYNEASGWTTALKTNFTNTGLYEVYRRIKDKPIADPNFAQYSYYSGPTKLEIYVHRKPIALATLEWDFDAAANVYRTTWIDKSYDADHEFNRPDKGIIERNIMWRQTGGDWNYGIPDNLSPGTYDLQYYVKDPEGAWSDPFSMNFTLSAIPGIQFDAKLRTLDRSFSLAGIPASESLEGYDIWTRYPYNVSLQMAFYKGPTVVYPVRTVNFNSSTGIKDVNDITWSNIAYQISDTVPDGTYTFRISAIGDYGPSSTKNFSVVVNTPIDPIATINGASSNAQVQSGSDNTLTLTTSKYVSSIIIGFLGKTYTSSSGAVSLVGNNGTRKTWELKTMVPENSVTDGETGNVAFTAYTPSGKSQTVNVDFNVVAIQAYDFTITSILDINWRGYYFDLYSPINNNGEKYGYVKRNNTDIKTIQMPINSLSLVSFPETAVKAGCKVKGYIKVKGLPDSIKLIAKYQEAGLVKQAYINTDKSDGNAYGFEWIIPQKVDRKTFICFDIEMKKASQLYGNDKWIDTWLSGNTTRAVFCICGTTLDDIITNQSN